MMSDYCRQDGRVTLHTNLLITSSPESFLRHLPVSPGVVRNCYLNGLLAELFQLAVAKLTPYHDETDMCIIEHVR